MAEFVVDDLDDGIVDRLQRRAARAGRSLEDEVLAILSAAVANEDAEPSEAAPEPADAITKSPTPD